MDTLDRCHLLPETRRTSSPLLRKLRSTRKSARNVLHCSYRLSTRNTAFLTIESTVSEALLPGRAVEKPCPRKCLCARGGFSHLANHSSLVPVRAFSRVITHVLVAWTTFAALDKIEVKYGPLPHLPFGSEVRGIACAHESRCRGAACPLPSRTAEAPRSNLQLDATTRVFPIFGKIPPGTR